MANDSQTIAAGFVVVSRCFDALFRLLTDCKSVLHSATILSFTDSLSSPISPSISNCANRLSS